MTLVSAHAHSTQVTMQLCLLVEQARPSLSIPYRHGSPPLLSYFIQKIQKGHPRLNSKEQLLKEPLCMYMARSLDAQNTFSMDLLVPSVNISGQACLFLVSSGLQALMHPKEGCTLGVHPEPLLAWFLPPQLPLLGHHLLHEPQFGASESSGSRKTRRTWS